MVFLEKNIMTRPKFENKKKIDKKSMDLVKFNCFRSLYKTNLTSKTHQFSFTTFLFGTFNFFFLQLIGD